MLKPMKNYFRLLAQGHKNGILSRALQPVLEVAGGIYGGTVGCVRSLYEKKVFPSKRLPFPVVSIGNLTWGGTGKTPLVEYLARKISEQQRTPLILTRGYGKDEVEQMRHHLPRALFGVGRDRYQTAQSLAKNHKIDIAILDDGLQHWALSRDMEVITINAINPFGNGKLIPRGILREPVSILNKASVVVIAHVNLVAPDELERLRQVILKVAPKVEITESYLEPLFFYRAEKRSRVSLDRLARERVTTFSGVACPRSFQLLLAHHGVKPVRNFEFGDHHAFSEAELKEIKEVSDAASAGEIVTTEKDFYRAPERITRVLNPLVLAARLRIKSGDEALSRRILPLLGVS